MSTLAPDEKLCPFCAETIKAAAVKCRFCQSDLPEETAPADIATEDVAPAGTVSEAAASETAAGGTPSADQGPVGLRKPEPDALPEPLPEPGPVVEERSSGRRGLSTLAALVVLCLVLGAALGFLVHRSLHPHLGIAPDGQVTDASFRNAAMSAASDAATQALSYSWQSFDQDRKKARALMGPKLARQYDDAMDKVAQQTATSKLTLKASVLSAGLLSAEEHKAKVLLFVNTLTTREGSKKQQLDQNRVVMELVRKDGDWTVSRMDAF